MTEKEIDRQILNIDPEVCCCDQRHKKSGILSAALEYGQDLGRVEISAIPKFRFCPWCGAFLDGL